VTEESHDRSHPRTGRSIGETARRRTANGVGRERSERGYPSGSKDTGGVFRHPGAASPSRTRHGAKFREITRESLERRDKGPYRRCVLEFDALDESFALLADVESDDADVGFESRIAEFGLEEFVDLVDASGVGHLDLDQHGAVLAFGE